MSGEPLPCEPAIAVSTTGIEWAHSFVDAVWFFPPLLSLARLPVSWTQNGEVCSGTAVQPDTYLSSCNLRVPGKRGSQRTAVSDADEVF